MRTNGINHLALVCRDMEETVSFYRDILQMPLVKTIALPDGGQHFFFDAGNNTAVAFFWWPETPAAAPGIASVKRFPKHPKSAVGSMNHVAFDMAEEELEAGLARLEAAGVKPLPVVVNHDDSQLGVSPDVNDGVFMRSVYFADPNGIMLEFCCTRRAFTAEDVRHEPMKQTKELLPT